ncbi:unnamed protein product [Ranitomeya imitator]|uniref:Gypsy retrotransposon integrase-like protein 1 n=1 Tax=Ranitomeya imitator TaxID=111125 RepID=A0ABN9MF10_9NEOB|nr:unnamed protein product [Ranitomeya imitator]
MKDPGTSRYRYLLHLFFMLTLPIGLAKSTDSTSFWKQKAVIDGKNYVGKLLFTDIPALSEITVCLDIFYRNNAYSTAFSYCVRNEKIPEISLSRHINKLEIRILGKLYNVHTVLNQNIWHTVCLMWKEQTNLLEVYVNETRVFSATTEQRKIMGNGSLVLGAQHTSSRGQIQINASTTMSGDIYNYQMWNYTRSQEKLLNCMEGNLISWTKEDWDFRKLSKDVQLRCAANAAVTPPPTTSTTTLTTTLGATTSTRTPAPEISVVTESFPVATESLTSVTITPGIFVTSVTQKETSSSNSRENSTSKQPSTLPSSPSGESGLSTKVSTTESLPGNDLLTNSSINLPTGINASTTDPQVVSTTKTTTIFTQPDKISEPIIGTTQVVITSPTTTVITPSRSSSATKSSTEIHSTSNVVTPSSQPPTTPPTTLSRGTESLVSQSGTTNITSATGNKPNKVTFYFVQITFTNSSMDAIDEDIASGFIHSMMDQLFNNTDFAAVGVTVSDTASSEPGNVLTQNNNKKVLKRDRQGEGYSSQVARALTDVNSVAEFTSVVTSGIAVSGLPPSDIRVLQDTAVDMDIQALCSSMDNLVALGLLYDEPNSVDQAEKNLLALCQGQDDVEVYCQKFRKWSVLTLWNESALAALFRKGLSEALKDVMVGFPMPAGLNESMSLAIQIGRRLRERKSVHHLAVLSESKPEPMQCDRTMTKVERQEHRRLNRLCFYCGDSTHAISNCPKRTRRFDSSAVIGTVQSKFLLSITLMCSLSSYSVMAFVDSGAALNLMDLDYAKRCGFFLEPLRCPIPLRGIDATPLAKNKPQYWSQLTMCMAPAHQEVIRFLVLHNLHDVVVLGLPWLQTHNPVLDWNSMSVTSWGCQGVHGDVPFLSISSSIPSDIPEFLSDFQDVFEESKSDALPPHRNCDCAIDLIPGSKFPKGRLFNLSVPEHTAMRSYVKESLEKGHIRPSSSPLGAGFFFVAKKDGSLRPCIDYRLLNKITVKFQYPLPLISDLFARIKGANWFTKIDLRGAYNLVRIRQGDEWKTAFNTPEGHFEYLVMPFGLANAPSVFQSFMHDIFREYLDKFLIVYLDDILIFSDDWESHVRQVRMVFQVLRANSLVVKGSKCLFGVQKVSFLGFIFSPSTIEMDPVKVQAIQDWTQPTSLKSLQKFLGFANFYRRFICNFSSIARPLTDLTKKGADLVNWSSAAVEAFQELKRRFCCAPVLCQPDVSLPFQVEVDASEIGAGAVLSQRGSGCSVFKPCAFFSRKFSAAERNYDVGNRELLAMKWAFEEWRHWLEGAKHRVVVLTDHKNLTYLESAKRLNPRQARWSLFFARFDFVISYLPGSKNVKADALSRSFVPDSPGLSEPASILKEGVIVSAISPDLRRVLQKFQANKPDRCPAEKLFVPDRWTSKVISELHCSVLAGHPGIFGTRELVARSFWWPSLSWDHVVRLHGIPENIVSDRGSQFVSRFWRAFCGRMGIDLSFSSAFHPQTNGQTERTNQTLETYLRCFVSADQDDWVSFLPLAEFALNNRASSATLVSLFFCNSGFHPRFSSGQVESSDCPGVDSVVDRLQQIWTQVVDNLTLSQEKAQLFANRRRRVGPRLRVGDLVWLSSRHIPMKVSSPKFKPRFIGPYRISEILNPVSFRLTLPDSFSIHNVFHRSLLRRYVAPMVPSVEPPAPVLVEGELEYIVEKILDSRVSRRKLQYLVKWKGYAQEDNSWVFASDVHAPDLVRAFHKRETNEDSGESNPPEYIAKAVVRANSSKAQELLAYDLKKLLVEGFADPELNPELTTQIVTADGLGAKYCRTGSTWYENFQYEWPKTIATEKATLQCHTNPNEMATRECYISVTNLETDWGEANYSKCIPSSFNDLENVPVTPGECVSDIICKILLNIIMLSSLHLICV